MTREKLTAIVRIVMAPSDLAALDRWCEAQAQEYEPLPRSVAIRRILLPVIRAAAPKPNKRRQA